MNGTTIYEAAKYWFPLLKLALMPLALPLLLSTGSSTNTVVDYFWLGLTLAR